MGKKSALTIEDIARIANVSKSTVSRALNNNPLIKVETREQIQVIAREHNFHMNAQACCLSIGQSRTIALVTHSSTEQYAMEDLLFGVEIMYGITSGLHMLGYDSLYVNADPHDTQWARQYLQSGRVDGFILITSTRKQHHIKTLAELEAPFIIWGIPNPKYRCPSVTGDNITGGRLATEHLIQIGRDRIGFIGGSEDELEVQYRFNGYSDALQSVGRMVDPNLIAYGDYSMSSGSRAMEQLLIQAPGLDAVFVNSDLMAIGAINYLQGKGKMVPDDVAVVGYDDLSIAALNNLPLTTIRQDIPLAGKLLAQNLINFIQTGVVNNVTVPVELVIRKSA